MKLYEYLEKILIKENEEENAIVYDDEKLKQRFENLKKKIDYIKPSYNVEKPEIERITKEFTLTENEVKKIENQFEKNKIVNLKYSEIDNSDYSSVDNFGQVLELVKKYGKDIDRLLTQFEEGKIEAPVILIKKGKNPYLIGGNTRLMLLKTLGMNPKVLEIKI